MFDLYEVSTVKLLMLSGFAFWGGLGFILSRLDTGKLNGVVLASGWDVNCQGNVTR